MERSEECPAALLLVAAQVQRQHRRLKVSHELGDVVPCLAATYDHARLVEDGAHQSHKAPIVTHYDA